MCRSKAQGGRRCPSQSDPQVRAEQNYKRREKYAASKREGNDKERNLAADSALVGFSHPMFKDSPITKRRSSLDVKNGIVLTELQGKFVDSGAFQKVELSGVIDPKTIDSGSYKDFGFEDVNENYLWSRRGIYATENLSEEELKPMTIEEKSCIKAYTFSDTCREINAALENDWSTLQATAFPKTELKGKIEDIYVDDDDFGITNTAMTKSCPPILNELVKNIDSALTKGPKIQRIVYRGVNRVRGVDRNRSFRTQEFFKENYKLGETVQFNSFLSTSTHPHLASSFGQYGAVFEILTPEGVHIGDASNIPGEEEVLLPRNSRYVVVGKKEEVQRSADDGEKITVIQMVAVDENNRILDSENSNRKPEKFELKGKNFSEAVELMKKEASSRAR